jgi:RNA polymerase sigma factor (sigma-70 family)
MDARRDVADKPTDPARSLTDPSDQELVAEYAATRSPALFNRIVERHGPMVLQTSLRLVGNWHDAEDVTQAVFLLLAQRAGSVKSTLGGWLHKVARDVAIEVLRARASRARREEEAVRRQAMPDPATERELREELDVALVRLPDRVREAVVLRYLEGRGQEEAARITGCDNGTLSRRCTQGLNRLGAMLGRRGAPVAPAVLVGFLSNQAAGSTMPAATLTALQGIGAGGAVASAQAAVLAKSAAQAMFWAKAKLCAAVLGVASVATAGVVTPLVLSKSHAPVTSAPSSPRDVLLRLDFEDGKLPALCTTGKVVKGPERAGNRFCLEGAPDPGHGHLVTLSKDDALAAYSDDLCLVFDIYVDASVATVDMNLWNRTRQLDHGIEPLSFPRERWVEGVVVPFADFKNGPARTGLKPGDAIINLRIHAGQPGGVIWIDNLEIVRSPALRSSRPPK